MPGIVLLNPVTQQPEYVPEDRVGDYVRRGYTTPAGGATTETASGRRVVIQTPELEGALATGGTGVASHALAAQQDEEAYRAKFDTLGQEAITFGEGALEGLTAGGSRLLLNSEESQYRREVNPYVHGAGVIGGAVAPALAGEEGSLAGILRASPAGLTARAGEAAAGVVKLAPASRIGQALVKGAQGAIQGSVDAGLYGTSTQAVDSLLNNRPFAAEAVLSDALLGAGLGGGLGFAAGGLGKAGKYKDINPAVEANTADALGEMGARLRHQDAFIKAARNDVAELVKEPGAQHLAGLLGDVQKAEKQLKAVAGLKHFDGAEAKLARRLKGLDGEEAQLLGRALDDYEVAASRLDDGLQPFRNRPVPAGEDLNHIGDAGIPEAKRGVLLDTPLGKVDPYNFNPEKYMEHWGTPEYREVLRQRFNFMADDYVDGGKAFERFRAPREKVVFAMDEAHAPSGDKTGAYSPNAVRQAGASADSHTSRLIDSPLGKFDPEGPPLHDVFPDKVGTPEYAEAVSAKADWMRAQLRPRGPMPEPPAEVPVGTPTRGLDPQATNPGRKPAPREPTATSVDKTAPGDDAKINAALHRNAAAEAKASDKAADLAKTGRVERPQVTKDTAPSASRTKPRAVQPPYSAKAPRLSKDRIGARVYGMGNHPGGGGIQAMDVMQVANLMGADVAKVPGAGPIADAAMKVWALNRMAKGVAQAEKGTGGIFGHIMRAAEMGGAGGFGRRIGRAVVGHAVGGPVGAAVGYALGRDVWNGVGRLAGTAGRGLQRVSAATGRLLGKTAPHITKGVTAAKAISDIHLGPPSADDPRDHFQRLRAELGRSMASPDAMDEMVDDHFAGVRTLAPDVADAAREAYKLRLKNIAAMMPKPPPGLYRPEQWAGDPVAISTFYRYLRASEDPYGQVIDRLEKASPIEIKALQDNWPETLNEVRRQLIERGDEVQKLNHTQAAKISEVLGQPVVGFADPGMWRRQQSLYEAERQMAQQQQGQGGATNGGSPKNLDGLESPGTETPGQVYSEGPGSAAPGNR